MSRQFIFKHYWWMALLGAIIGIVIVVTFASDGRVGFIGSVVAGVLAFCYFAQTQKLQEMALFHRLFTDFNRRYDDLNSRLAAIPVEATANDDARAAIVDYFNLCAEDYLWFSEGYIPGVVWKAWCSGMLVYLQREPFRTVWAEEVTTGSYYGLSLEVIRDSAG